MKSGRQRWIAGLSALALLTVLWGWQRHRHQLEQACDDALGLWDGAHSQCLPKPGGPILQRDLRRS